MKKLDTGIIIGYGSIGKRHAKIMNEIVPKIIIIDNSKEKRENAKSDYPNAMVYERIKDIKNWGEVTLGQAYSVISTLGPSHHKIFNLLADNGIKKILCEKPMASSVNNAYQMHLRAKADGISLVLNHYIRYSNLVDSLNEFSRSNSLGDPVSIVTGGGASCIVTNGIHWIDFAMQLFRASPNKVFSTSSEDKINPRSEDLGFYGGNAIWSFPDGREAVISMTNLSSIAARCKIFYRNAIVEFYDDLSVTIMHRDMDSIKRYPAITRTGYPKQLLYEGMLPNVNDFLGSLERAHNDLIENNDNHICDSSIGLNSISTVIGALFSGCENRPVQLPINPESDWGMYEWPIS